MPETEVDPLTLSASTNNTVSKVTARGAAGSAALPFVWNSAASVLTLVTGIAASFLSARYLGPTGFGIFGLVQWTRITAAMFLDIGMSSAMTKFSAELMTEGRSRLAPEFGRAVLWVQVAVAVPAACAMFVFAPFIASLVGDAGAASYIRITAATLGLTLVNNVLGARLLAQGRFAAKSLVDTVIALGWLVAVVSVLLMDSGIIGLVVVESTVAGVQLLLLLWLSRSIVLQWPMLRFPKAIARRVWHYSVGVFMLTAFDAVIWQRSEVLFLAIFRGADDVGYFTIAYGLAVTLITLLPHSLGVVIFPSLSERFGANDRMGLTKIYNDSTRHIAIMTLPLCVGGVAVASEIVRILYGAAFDPAGQVLRVLFVGATIGALATPGSGLLLALDRAGTRSLFAVPMVVLNVVLAVALVPPFGPVGAAVAKSATQLVHVTADVVYLAMYQQFRIDLVPLARVAAASVAPGAVALAVVQNFPGPVGLAVSIVLGAIAYVAALVWFKAVPETDIHQLRDAIGRLPIVSAQR